MFLNGLVGALFGRVCYKADDAGVGRRHDRVGLVGVQGRRRDVEDSSISHTEINAHVNHHNGWLRRRKGLYKLHGIPTLLSEMSELYLLLYRNLFSRTSGEIPA